MSTGYSDYSLLRFGDLIGKEVSQNLYIMLHKAEKKLNLSSFSHNLDLFWDPFCQKMPHFSFNSLQRT